MAVQSLWTHKPWSKDYGASFSPQTLSISVPGSMHLRKVLIHAVSVQAYSMNVAAGGIHQLPSIRYAVDWYPAGGQTKRIFQAVYRIPTFVVLYPKDTVPTYAFFCTHHAGDNECGVNQRYNYNQEDSSHNGIVNLTHQISPVDQSGSTTFGYYEGIFSVLAQSG